jgi:hypothetical protein
MIYRQAFVPWRQAHGQVAGAQLGLQGKPRSPDNVSRSPKLDAPAPTLPTLFRVSPSPVRALTPVWGRASRAKDGTH